MKYYVASNSHWLPINNLGSIYVRVQLDHHSINMNENAEW